MKCYIATDSSIFSLNTSFKSFESLGFENIASDEQCEMQQFSLIPFVIRENMQNNIFSDLYMLSINLS